MAKTEHYFQKLEAGCFFHIYNRGIDRKNIFKNDDNYKWFLLQYDKYMSDVVDTWSYALLGNHFHFGIQVKPMEELLQFYRNSLNPNKPLKKGTDTAHSIVSRQFQKLFQSYAMAFNKQQNRVGTLFQTPFKRCAVDPDKIMDLLTYHHFNPQYHGLCKDFRTYSWTSYRRYLLPGESKLPKIKVMEIFGGPEKYIRYNNQAYTDLKSSYYIEDED